MVTYAKLIFSLFLILMALSANAEIKPALKIELKNEAGEYGKPVYIKIIAYNQSEVHSQDRSQNDSQKIFKDIFDNVSTLYAEKLSKDFAIENIDFETENTRHLIRIKMYPRRTGTLLIPAVSHGKVMSLPASILIRPAKSKKGDIRLSSKKTSTEVWQRQQILVSLTLSTAEEFASIKLNNQRTSQKENAIEITALPISRVWNNDNNIGVSTITTALSILPLQSGTYEIELPEIEYHLNGVIRRIFVLPKLKLNVRPLPRYLPPTIPVGEIKISSSIKSDNMISEGLSRVLNTGKLAYWDISITSKTLTPYWLPSVLRQIKNNESLQFFPAKSKRSMQLDEYNVNGNVSHSVPFKILSQGRKTLPEVKIQYFDPTAGKLVNLTLPVTNVYSIHTASIYLIGIFLIISIFYLLRLVIHFFYKWITYKLAYRSSLRNLQQANTIDEIIEELKFISSVEGWPINISLTDWLKYWEAKYERIEKLEDLFDTINRLRFRLNISTLGDINTTSLTAIASPGSIKIGKEIASQIATTQHWYQRK